MVNEDNYEELDSSYDGTDRDKKIENKNYR